MLFEIAMNIVYIGQFVEKGWTLKVNILIMGEAVGNAKCFMIGAHFE